MNQSSARASQSRPGPLIFVVDDQQDMLELAATVLEGEGYEVKTFLSAEAALKAFIAANPRPQLLVTDFCLGRMNGLELIRECRRLNPGQKTIMASGSASGSAPRDPATRPDRFLPKPYWNEQLIDLVRDVLRARHLRET